MQIKTIKAIKKKGVFPILKKACIILLSPVFLSKRLYMIEHDLSLDIPDTTLPEGYQYRRLTAAEMDLLLNLVGRDRVEKYRQRIVDGLVCFSILKEGNVVSFCWISENPVKDDILRFEIPVGADEAYFFDSFTKPEERNHGLFFTLLLEGLHRFRLKGKRRVIAVHCREDLVKVYPKYRKNGIPLRTVKVVDNRKIFKWRKVHWTEYNGENDVAVNIPSHPAATVSD